MDYMALYNNITGDTISRSSFFAAAKRVDPSFKETQIRFYIGKMQEQKLLFRIGRGLYSKGVSKATCYRANNSKTAKIIISILTKEYPLVSFRVWDLFALNEFANHLMARNCVFLETEADGMEFIYQRLIKTFPKNVLLNPSKKEIDAYSADGSIIITPLKSECPKGIDGDYNLSLEKLIVDMFANRTLQLFVSKGDYPLALEEMFSKYNINQTKLFRYARRRNKEALILSFLREKTNVKILAEDKR